MPEKRGIPRRDFLKSAVAIGGTAAFSACLGREEVDTEKRDLEFRGGPLGQSPQFWVEVDAAGLGTAVDVVLPAAGGTGLGRESPPDGTHYRAVEDHHAIVGRVGQELLDEKRAVASGPEVLY